MKQLKNKGSSIKQHFEWGGKVLNPDDLEMPVVTDMNVLRPRHRMSTSDRTLAHDLHYPANAPEGDIAEGMRTGKDLTDRIRDRQELNEEKRKSAERKKRDK